MAVDVVVVNYRTPDLLRDFVKSYERHKFAGCSLTVVEVDSPEAMYEGPDEWIFIPENVGYARACNRGARDGENDVILLANADTLLTSGLQECHDVLMAHEDWGVLGPRQVGAFNQITAGGIFGHDRAPQQRGWNENDLSQYSDVRDDATTVSGALYFIKRDLWKSLTECQLYQDVAPDALGAFLPTQHYFEETFCSYHARAHGFKCVFYGPVQMIHYWHAASAHGSSADMQFGNSQAYHRQACAHHGIICE